MDDRFEYGGQRFVTLGQLEGRVCRVEISGQAAGTGFLCGPGLVMTNYHVVGSIIEATGGARPEAVADLAEVCAEKPGELFVDLPAFDAKVFRQRIAMLGRKRTRFPQRGGQRFLGHFHRRDHRLVIGMARRKGRGGKEKACCNLHDSGLVCLVVSSFCVF